MKRFLASVALTLFNSDCLCRRFYFDAIKVQLEATYLFQTLAGSDEYCLTLQLGMASYLKTFNKFIRTIMNSFWKKFVHPPVIPFRLIIKCVVNKIV